MQVTDSITVGPEWAVHERPSDWPVRAGQVFIVGAFDQIMEAMFGLNGVDLLADPIDTGGYGTAAASHLRQAVMAGGLTVQVQPTAGGPLRRTAPTDWTPVGIDAAIASGQTSRRLKRKPVAHWVFVDGAELSLMLTVLRATNMLYDPAEYGPLETLGDIVLSNMPSIARPAPDTDPVAEAEAVIRLFIPSSRFDFDSDDDRDRFIDAGVVWLLGKFKTDHDHRLVREDFEELATRSFGKYMSGRIFDRIWRKTVAAPRKPDGTIDRDKPDPHKRRRTAGRRVST